MLNQGISNHLDNSIMAVMYLESNYVTWISTASSSERPRVLQLAGFLLLVGLSSHKEDSLAG